MWRAASRNWFRQELQQRHRVPDVAEALPGIFLQTAPQQHSGSRRDAVPARLRLNHFRQDLGKIFAVEQLSAGEHFVQNHAEGPDIGAFIDYFATRLFG